MDLQAQVPNDVMPLEFWKAVNAEMERILDRYHLVMVNVRQENKQSYANEFEWPPHPEGCRTQENMALDHLIRSGGIWTSKVTEQVSELIRETSQNMIGEVLAPYGQNINDLRSSTRPEEQQRNTSREDDD